MKAEKKREQGGGGREGAEMVLRSGLSASFHTLLHSTIALKE